MIGIQTYRYERIIDEYIYVIGYDFKFFRIYKSLLVF